jgi:hypothetical protein
MFCIKCGTENPADAEFCYKCGRPLFAHQSQSGNLPAPNVLAIAADAMAADSASGPSKSVSNYTWETAYGWLFVLGGLYLWVQELIAFYAGTESTPSVLPSLSVKPMDIGISLLQALLFGATGLAIIRRKKVAVVLVWLNIGLSGLGVLLRGLIPMDLLLWIAGLGLAIWYTATTLPLEKPQPQEGSQPFAGRTNSWLEANGFGLVVVLVLALLALALSLVKWSDRRFTSFPTTGATPSQVRRQNDKRPLTPEESKELQNYYLISLSPKEVISRCGVPLGDKIEPCDGCKFKESLRRDMSYKRANNSPVILSFYNYFGRSSDKDWDFTSMSDGGTEYYVLENDDRNQILSAVPCVAERIP